MENAQNPDTQDVVVDPVATDASPATPEAALAAAVIAEASAAAETATTSADPAIPGEGQIVQPATDLVAAGEQITLSGVEPIAEDTVGFFAIAVPDPTSKNFHAQLGCFYEEVAETIKTVVFKNNDRNNVNRVAVERLEKLAADLKAGKARIASVDWTPFVDGMLDTRVTAIGVMQFAGVNVNGAIGEVDRSNFSKFVDGKPVFEEGGKITKGPNFSAPNLSPYLPAEFTILGK